MLVGQEDDKMYATIISSKKEVYQQFYHPGRNKVINVYKNIHCFLSWDSEKVK